MAGALQWSRMKLENYPIGRHESTHDIEAVTAKNVSLVDKAMSLLNQSQQEVARGFESTRSALDKFQLIRDISQNVTESIGRLRV